jgi:flagellar motility protein MotE (MotC chaperone)
MINYIRDLRLIPIALIASVCLLALKTADLALHSSSLFADNELPAGEADVSVIRPMPDAIAPPGSPLLSWAQQMFNFPGASGVAPAPRSDALPLIAERDLPDITGSVDADAAKNDAKNGAKNAPDAKNDPKNDPKNDTKSDAKSDAKNAPAAPRGKDGKATVNGTVIPTDTSPFPTGAERAILERLQERRQELDARARELDIRESLIQGAEKRMDAKLNELKEVEGRIKVETEQKDDAEVSRLKGLVTMYENMKPRDAAKIFDRLEISVLLEVASQIKPQKMSDILAQMSPDAAERLTVELASKAQQSRPGGTGELPKIQGTTAAP